MKCVQCGKSTDNKCGKCMKCLCAKFCKPGNQKDCKLYQRNQCMWPAWINR